MFWRQVGLECGPESPGSWVLAWGAVHCKTSLKMYVCVCVLGGMLNSTARVIFQKCKSNVDTPAFKSFAGFLIALKIKSQVPPASKVPSLAQSCLSCLISPASTQLSSDLLLGLRICACSLPLDLPLAEVSASSMDATGSTVRIQLQHRLAGAR